MMSLAFVNSPPTYVYPGVVFEATVRLVDDQTQKNVVGCSQDLDIHLRYFDTLEPVPKQLATIELSNRPHIHDNSGAAIISAMMHLGGATCDGQRYCLEVSSLSDPSLSSIKSSPIVPVKERLVITQQPPDVWYKDEGGREKCMVVSLSTEAAPGVPIEPRVIPLRVRLLYETGAQVLKQSILRLFPDMNPNMTNGRVKISFRIDDVSKNHQGQGFVVEIAPDTQDTSSMFQDIAPIHTSVISIRSKRNKRKIHANGSAFIHSTPRNIPQPPSAGSMMSNQGPSKALARDDIIPDRQTQHYSPIAYSSAVEVSDNDQWNNPSPRDNHIEWRLIGFEIHSDGSSDTNRPIYRCPNCRKLNDVDMVAGNAAEHDNSCPVLTSMYSPQHFIPSSYQDNSYASSVPMAQSQPFPITNLPRNLFMKENDANGHRPELVTQPVQSQSMFQLPSSETPLDVEKLSVVSKIPEMDPADDHQQSNLPVGMAADGSTTPLTAGLNSALFSEMNNMGIPWDGFDKNNALDAFGDVGEANEDMVYYILARMYLNEDGQSLGLPAFDRFQSLLGFYSEVQVDAQTQMVFHGLNALNLSANDKSTITNEFRQEVQLDSSAVHSLPKYQNNLVLLREDALMYYWSQSLGSFGVN